MPLSLQAIYVTIQGEILKIYDGTINEAET